MNRQGHEHVEFFLGPEVELTPAHAKRTLFVVGYQEPEVVYEQAKSNKVQHVYFGANHSFDPELVTKGNTSKSWNELVTYLLDRGFYVTLDYQAHMHNYVLPMLSAGVWQSRLFIPMLSVRIPKVQTSNNNLTIKIDDIDFAATNDGVWCLNHSEVTDSNRFTAWQDYTTDQVLTIGVAAEPVLLATRKVVNIDTGNATPAEAAIIVQTIREATPSPIINDVDAGLDKESTSALKPETQEDSAPNIDVVNTSPADAAAAYAGNVKEDPLSKESSTKAKHKK